MSDKNKAAVGSLVWHDLTVEDAAGVRDFYAKVVGWKPEPVSIGDYDDYNMTKPESGEGAVGICHARGPNAKIPPQWLIYVQVADLEASVAACRENGGTVLDGPRDVCGNRFCVIKDPAGAVLGLIA